LKDEPGTLQFEVPEPQESDARVLMYEVYRDAARLDAHRSGAVPLGDRGHRAEADR
jgi:quinol monooxygenase YgiN